RLLAGFLFLALTAVYVVVIRVGGNGGQLGRGGGLLVELPDALFHLLAWLERHHGFPLDIDALTPARISGPPRLAPLDLENAEITKFDSSFGKQRVNDRIESLLHDFLGLELSHAQGFRDLLDDFFLGHGPTPCKAWNLELFKCKEHKG